MRLVFAALSVAATALVCSKHRVTGDRRRLRNRAAAAAREERRKKQPGFLDFADPKSVTLRFDNTKNVINNFVIVTGSSANHIKVLQLDLLWSIKEYILNNPAFPFNVKVIFYDLDVSPELQVKNQQMLKSYPFVEYRTFDFASYPDFFDISIAAGEYAWKPIIVKEVVREQRSYGHSKTGTRSISSSFVYWLDAGNCIDGSRCPGGPLTDSIAYASEFGIFTPRAGAQLSKYTHQGTADYLNLSQEIYKRRSSWMCSANIVLVDATNDKVYEDIILPWAECAQIKDCIAPPGSSKQGHHRQDQSVLSVLMAKHGRDTPPLGTSCIRRGHG